MKGIALNDLQFRIAVGVGAALLVLAMVRMRYCYEFKLPEVPAAPAMTRSEIEQVTKDMNKSAATYDTFLRRDSRRYGIRPPADTASMSAVFRHRVHTDRAKLRPGDPPVKAAGLELRVLLQNISGSPMRQMVLEIRNTLDEPLAYKVTTRPSKGTKPCHRKRTLNHNAVAIAPGATEIRSECIYRKRWALNVVQVETIELPELSYIYVSAVPPAQLALDGRTSAGHQPVSDAALCETMHAANILRGVDRKEISWRDLIDFYGRHTCKTYSFPYGYKAFRGDGEHSLPVANESY